MLHVLWALQLLHAPAVWSGKTGLNACSAQANADLLLCNDHVPDAECPFCCNAVVFHHSVLSFLWHDTATCLHAKALSDHALQSSAEACMYMVADMGE